MDALSPNFGGWFQNLMELQIVACWTAFESLAVDLWIASVNTCPNVLAFLPGSPKRLASGKQRKSEATSSVPGEQVKSVLLSDIQRVTKGSFDIKSRMGDILEGQFRFTSLSGIRHAYASAFPEKTPSTAAIDAVLSSNPLNILSAVRNLIVHKSGVADRDYLNDIKHAVGAPPLSLNDRLNVNGEIACNIIEPAIQCCVDLIVSVDSWLASNA